MFGASEYNLGRATWRPVLLKFWTGKVGPVRLLDCYRTILRTRRPRHLTSYRARYARTAISGNGWRWTASGNANREQPVNSVKIGGHEGRSKPQKAQRLCSHPAGRRCQRWIWQRRHLHWMSLPTTDHSVPCHVLSHLQSICFDFPVCIWSCFCRATAANMLTVGLVDPPLFHQIRTKICPDS